MPGRRVVERRGNDVLDVDLMVVRDAVELAGGDARLHVRLEEIEELGREPTRHAHPGDVFRRFERNRHERRQSAQARRSSLMLVFARVLASTCLTMTAQ